MTGTSKNIKSEAGQKSKQSIDPKTRSEAEKRAIGTPGQENLSAAGQKGEQFIDPKTRSEAEKKAVGTPGQENLSAAGRKSGEHSQVGKSPIGGQTEDLNEKNPSEEEE